MPSSSSIKLSGWENLLFLSTLGVGVYFFQNVIERTLGKGHPPVRASSPLRFRNPKSPLAQEAQVAIDLALQAGAKMYPYCNEKGTVAELDHDLGISEKGQPEDFFTKIDVENERLVTDELLKHFPTHQIIGEESTGDPGTNLDY